MSRHAARIELLLAGGPQTARQLALSLGVSQATVSRSLSELGGRVVRQGAARSIQYTLYDDRLGLAEVPVYRVDAEGRLQGLGRLVPVRPEGFVMRQNDGVSRHSDGWPWWMTDMRPQGFLGRAYAARHGATLGLPTRLQDWSETQKLRALLAQGHDAVGNLLLGDVARGQFLNQPAVTPLPAKHLGRAYARMAQAASQGEAPGSSAGGEQPKFTATVTTADGPRHVLVKFSEPEAGPVTERWRDLLLAEHLALDTLRHAGQIGLIGASAARSRLLDHAGQRFLETERFDRIGLHGRTALLSLAALDMEFVGAGPAPWPVVARRLAEQGHVSASAADGAALLWAFGMLIGNTDMHHGNLSFVAEHGRPYALAPAYDMTPMAFAPRTGGGLRDTLEPPVLHPAVAHATWHQALDLAEAFVTHLEAASPATARAQTHTPLRLSPRFAPCLTALCEHVDGARGKIARLG